ncbi:MAG: sulfurtransferase-like selenium metabolism protein YedF [Syntrophomonadaceae bacterium]|nr:sulfurtransferase-like selenium metabolism protein YedF [Syntrophomonadaceae bacterium]
MSRTVDARGLTCPQPVILTKREMDRNRGEIIVTLVDNSAALENVCKLATSQGYDFTVESHGPESHIQMTPKALPEEAAASGREVAILVKSDVFGQGNDELGAVLTKSFLYTLTEMSSAIHTIIFMNGGIHLTTAGSPVLEHLEYLQENGVQILSCGTCLDFFDKKEKLKVGQVTNMYTAVEIVCQAGKALIF